MPLGSIEKTTVEEAVTSKKDTKKMMENQDGLKEMNRILFQFKEGVAEAAEAVEMVI